MPMQTPFTIKFAVKDYSLHFILHDVLVMGT
jgi:hypothetical protein